MSDRNKPGNLYRRANTITAAQIKQKAEGAGGKERERESEREGGEEKTQINRVYLVRASNAKQRTSRSADGEVISPGHLHNSKSSKKVSPQFHRLFSLSLALSFSLAFSRTLSHPFSPFLSCLLPPPPAAVADPLLLPAPYENTQSLSRK